MTTEKKIEKLEGLFNKLNEWKGEITSKPESEITADEWDTVDFYNARMRDVNDTINALEYELRTA